MTFKGNAAPRPEINGAVELGWATAPRHWASRPCGSAAVSTASSPRARSACWPGVTLVSAQAGVALPHGPDLGLGVSNLGNVNLAGQSPLYLHAETPRSWRLTLRGRW